MPSLSFRCHVPAAPNSPPGAGCDNEEAWKVPAKRVGEGHRQAGPYFEAQASDAACPECGNPGTADADLTVFLLPTPESPAPGADALVERLAQDGPEQVEAAIARLRKRQEAARRGKRRRGD